MFIYIYMHSNEYKMCHSNYNNNDEIWISNWFEAFLCLIAYFENKYDNDNQKKREREKVYLFS